MNNLWPDDFCQFGSYTTIVRLNSEKCQIFLFQAQIAIFEEKSQKW